MGLGGDKLEIATVLGVASAIVLSAVSAEARDARKAVPARGAVARDAHAYQSACPFAQSPSGPRVYRPSIRDAYGFIDDGVGYDGSGTFCDGRRVPGTNWNPNQ